MSAQGFIPEEAARRMTAAEGMKVTLFASEPEVRQPIFVKCDDRGRLWTIQYLQYPNPAGLTRVKVDRWSRTVYDRVPEPPPRGPRGADRITILEDTDGDGRADRTKDFVDGLNLVTGVEFGHGGVFVLNVPYLLFYPDANRDDVPDGEPKVLLTGFGMEDAQSFANHLTWGPDGWLYGVNGSTTTCNIRGIEFQQGVWRYHPVTRAFELFCEGGSNCYGLTFDANGELFYSTNGGPFVHAVQGGYFYKSFGKHGPLHNLHAYHHFPELKRDAAPGGPPTGGTIYLADALPGLRGAFVAGNFLGHTVSKWTVERTGSTVRATYGGVILDSHDTWCGPTDVCVGPDGALYVSDFYDQRTAHPDPDANWDRSNGRIYKVAAKDARGVDIPVRQKGQQADGGRSRQTGMSAPRRTIDLHQLKSDELVDLLTHSNHWFAERARVELATRRDAAVVPRLRAMATQHDDKQLALEAVWALAAVGEFDEPLALALLEHPEEYVRFWSVRLAGDKGDASLGMATRLIALAGSERSPAVRAQLAATAKRLRGADCVPIVATMLRSPQSDESDPRIPWLIWWTIESKAISDCELVVRTFAQPAMWSTAAARDNVLRLVRRYAAEGTPQAYEACLQMLRSAPATCLSSAHEQLRLGLSERTAGLQGVDQGDLFGGQAVVETGDQAAQQRAFQPVSGPLREFIERHWHQHPSDVRWIEMALRANVDGAPRALQAAVIDVDWQSDASTPLLALLREFATPEILPAMLKLATGDQPESTKLGALDVLAAHDDAAIMAALIGAYPNASDSVRARIRDVLFGRPTSALVFLKQVDLGKFSAGDVPIEQLRRLALHQDDDIDALVRKHWGNVGPGTPEEKLATMRRFNNDLRAGTGDAAKGKPLFAKHCGVCHPLHGEGNRIGPDLTSANRGDLAALLGNVVDPSAVIRREYMNYVVVTSSGQTLTGLLAEQDAASVTMLDAENKRTKIARGEIEELSESETSLMPERALDALSPQELRDLFAYLQK